MPYAAWDLLLKTVETRTESLSVVSFIFQYFIFSMKIVTLLTAEVKVQLKHKFIRDLIIQNSHGMYRMKNRLGI